MLEARWASRGVLLGARLTTRIRQARPLATISVRERIVCGALLLGAAIINLFQLARSGYGNTYYAAAVRSMLESWHNFFFVSFDPGGFVTIDKPPVDFWLQALSAKLFGLNGFSLALPQALAGIASVAVLYVLVRRIFGMLPAALAALALALSPVNVATNRDNIVDSMLALVILLAAWAAFKAVETGRMRWLLGCAALVGLGFNIKMLEAYLVVPAFAALYLLAAPHPWRRRVGRLALAGVLLLVVSLSWATVVDLTPASQRPYVGSSSTNSELNLAFGYNGIERLAGRLFGGGGSAGGGSVGGGGGQGASPARPATGTGESDFPRISAATSTRPTRATPPQGGGFGAFGTGGPGPLRLFNTVLGTQVSWLLPLALLGLLASCWQVRPRQLVATWRERWRAEWAEEPAGRATPQVALAVGTRLWSALRLTSPQQSWVLWGMWLLTMGVFFSVASFFHSYYMVMMTPAICALAGIGLVGLWRDYRQAGWRGWLLPIALVVTAGVQLHLLAGAPTNWGWLGPMIAIAALATAGCLCVLRLAADTAAGERLVAWLPSNSPLQRMGTAWLQVTPRLRGWAGRAGIITAVGVVGLLLAPAAWSAATVTSPGNEMTPSAGPRTMAFSGGGFGGGGFDVGASTDSRLITYLTAHQGKATYLLATQNAMSAAPYILRTGKPVMALGGFSGSDPILTTAGLREMISRGEVRYFLLASGRGFSLSPASLDELPPQVRDFLEGGAFARGGRGQRGSGGLGGFGGFGANASLTSWVTGHCAVVPTSQWRSTASTPASSGAGTPGGLGGFARGGGAGEALYDCATTH